MVRGGAVDGGPGPTEGGPGPAVSVRLGDPSPGADHRHVLAGVSRGVATGRGVDLDLSAVTVLSSPTVATVLWAQRRCVAHNLPFSVTCGHGRTRRLLARSGLVGPGSRTW
ncbi:hypothetical protein [Phycicoccus avicenniae]|uniref:hypothetical protein n=1 Tax=Phycicoccus avicenniae TaxID=2828860 RepID=UPI003D2E2C3D